MSSTPHPLLLPPLSCLILETCHTFPPLALRSASPARQRPGTSVQLDRHTEASTQQPQNTKRFPTHPRSSFCMFTPLLPPCIKFLFSLTHWLKIPASHQGSGWQTRCWVTMVSSRQSTLLHCSNKAANNKHSAFLCAGRHSSKHRRHDLASAF